MLNNPQSNGECSIQGRETSNTSFIKILRILSTTRHNQPVPFIKATEISRNLWNQHIPFSYLNIFFPIIYVNYIRNSERRKPKENRKFDCLEHLEQRGQFGL
eukprot:TRINITY_DN9590_c1_g1_i1.p1 TRINITY_DN9590_c1_g1~~TRINITY_DN9590_c1_g1_i1.p1  ORF type:complete len:102 (-),score=7.53 TRINITY_DN9590_c1_g1_i1:562-867(-)